MKSKFTPIAVVLTIILFIPVLAQAGMPLNSDGTVPAGPFQNLQNQIDAIEVPPGVLSGKGEAGDDSTKADGEIYTITDGVPVFSSSTTIGYIAHCADTNDIAITGQCFGNVNWSLSRAGIGSNDNLDNTARQICIFNKPSGDMSTGGAQVSCIKVPGP